MKLTKEFKKYKKQWNKIINNPVTKLIIIFLQLFLFVIVIKWGGYRLLTGLILGIVITGYTLMTGNPVVMWVLDITKKKEKYKMIEREWLKR